MHPIEEKLPFLPAQPGVYLMKGAQGAVLYVGKAKNLKARLRSYVGSQAAGNLKVSFLVPKVKELEIIVTQTEKEALLLENTLIKRHRPRYNIELKDDKTYLHILLDRTHPFPKFVPLRRPGRPKPGQLLFGPYSSASAMRDTLHLIQRLYPLRSCKDGEFHRRGRPCIVGQMGRCSCPCVGGIAGDKYREMVDQAVLILQGRSRELVRRLEMGMQEAADGLRFEEAAQLRDRIQSLHLTVERQRVVSETGEDRDVVAEWEEGKLTALAVLQVRDGHLTDRQGFTFAERVISLPELLRSFLQQYYSRPEKAVPPEILLPFEPEDRRTLEEVLAETRGGPCVLGVPRKGPKRRLLELARINARSLLEEQARRDNARLLALAEIQRKAGLPHLPQRIECFDISDLGGKLAVGSCVVFRDGLPWKEKYRKYRIRTVAGADDYAMMGEVLSRRFEKGREAQELPVLLLVDGGKGHLGVALRVLRDRGIEGVSTLAIAKVPRERKGRASGFRRVSAGGGEIEIASAGTGGFSDSAGAGAPSGPAGVSALGGTASTANGPKAGPELTDRIFRPGRVNPLGFSSHSPGLRLLQQVRDEAHRFSLTYHRKLRSRELEKSGLDEVPGIGPVRKMALFRAFGDLEGILGAEAEELGRALGLKERAARRLWEGLRSARGRANRNPG